MTAVTIPPELAAVWAVYDFDGGNWEADVKATFWTEAEARAFVDTVGDGYAWSVLRVPLPHDEEPAQDAPSAPLPATATPDPALGDAEGDSDAADDVSQRALRNADPSAVRLVDYGPHPHGIGSIEAVVERIQRAAAADERGPYVPVAEAVAGELAPDAVEVPGYSGAPIRGDFSEYTAEPVATRNGRPAVRILGDYVCWDTGNCNCATGPNGEHEPHCGLEPIVHIEELRRLGFTRPAGIPPGHWRQGPHAPRNLWVDGAHPEGVDVGRMDTPELAAHVVDAVNALRDAEPRDLTREESAAIRSRPLPPALADAGIDALRDHIRYLDWLRERRSTGITRTELLATRKERDEARETLARLRGFVEAERDRYNNARTGERDDCRGEKADALDQVVDWLDDNGAPAGRCAVTDLPADECRHCRWGENDADPPPAGLAERLLSKMTVTTTDALPEGVAMVIGPDAPFRLAADAAEVRRERDEARAEVERLRKGLNGLIDALDMTMAAAHECVHFERSGS